MRLAVDYYDSNKAYELSEDMQQDIIEAVDRLARNPLARKQYWGVVRFLDEIGIYIAYDWVGHRGEWFFPTYDDALMQEDWEFQCRD